MADDPRLPDPPRLPSARLVVRGIRSFVLFSLLGVLLALWWKTPASLRELARTLDWQTAVLILPLVGIDFLLGGLRYSLYLDGRVLSRVTLWDCMRANWANIFLGAVTPCQTGGGPAQIYMLWRSGARVPEAMLVAMVNFAATLVFFIVSAVTALLALPPALFGPGLTPLLRAGFVVIVAATSLVLALLFRPRIAGRMLAIVPGSRRRTRLRGMLETGLALYEESFLRLWRERRVLLAFSCVLTIVLFANKYLVGYVIVRALHQDSPVLLFIGLHCIHYFLIYFAPTPGASGISEVSSVLLMERIMSRDSLVLYAVAWRIFTTVIGAVIGGGVLLLEFQRQAREAAGAR